MLKFSEGVSYFPYLKTFVDWRFMWMNILEYIDSLMDQGYSEDEANTLAAYEFTDYHGEDD